MKKVSPHRRRITLKEVLTWLLITFCHYLAFAAYILIFLTIKYYIYGGDFWPSKIGHNIWIGFTISAPPLLNATLHIIYDEIGSPWTRVGMWIHSFAQMLLIPIVIFMYL